MTGGGVLHALLEAEEDNVRLSTENSPRGALLDLGRLNIALPFLSLMGYLGTPRSIWAARVDGNICQPPPRLLTASLCGMCERVFSLMIIEASVVP